MVPANANQRLVQFKVQDKPLNQKFFIAFMGNLMEDTKERFPC